MKNLRWQLLVVLLALAAIAAILWSQQTNVLPQVIEEPLIQPTSGGVYREALLGSFGRLNPVLDFYNPADRDIDRLIYSSLIRFDDRGLPQGDLAESWGISQDGTVYNFSIRSQAVWHDGEPVTSEDILFTIELLRDEQAPVPADIREFWLEIEVKTLDEKTLQFKLPEPFAPFMDYLAFGVLPRHLLSGKTFDQIAEDSFNLEPVGSGPYRFDQLIVEDGEIQGVALAAFDGYYGERAFIDQVFFHYYPDSQAALEAYRAGDVMGISQLSGQALTQALKEPSLNVYTGRLPRLSLAYMNLDATDTQFFQDLAVRRALLTGLNRRWIVDRILGGQAIIADGPVFPTTWAYYEGIDHIEYDPEAALDMLKDAGYTIPAEGGSVREKDGVELAFEIVFPDLEPYPAVAELMQENWNKLGVQVTLNPVSYEVLVSDYLEPRTYQMALVDLNMARTPDPDPYPFWHQAQITGGQNFAKWDDRQASEYLEQARVSTDLGERTKRYRNFQVRFTSELPAFPLYYPVYSYGVDQQVQGVSMGPLFDFCDRLNTMPAWYLETRTGGEEVVEVTATPEQQ